MVAADQRVGLVDASPEVAGDRGCGVGVVEELEDTGMKLASVLSDVNGLSSDAFSMRSSPVNTMGTTCRVEVRCRS